MFKKQDAAKAAGVSAPQKEKAPTSEGKGAKVSKHQYFTSAWRWAVCEALFIFAVVLLVLWGTVQ